MRVLILEDDRWLADSLAQTLTSLSRHSGLDSESSGKISVRICHNPEKVFGVLEKWWPDVLLADVVLGSKNLFVLLNEIQSYTDTRNLPVIMLSTTAKAIEIDDVAEYGVKKILNKAEITPESLRETLHEIIEKGKLA
jgi:CheY-like chemotaxis protein